MALLRRVRRLFGRKKPQEISKIWPAATFIRHYYHGYLNVVIVNAQEVLWTVAPEITDRLYSDIAQMGCEDPTLTHRVHRISIVNSEWQFDEFGGGDYPVIATDSDATAAYFMLKYGQAWIKNEPTSN